MILVQMLREKLVVSLVLGSFNNVSQLHMFYRVEL
jgi:hypothetical protein